MTRLNIPIRLVSLKIPAIWDIRSVPGNKRHSAWRGAFERLQVDASLDAFRVTTLDGWKCRKEFLAIERGDEAALLAFLRKVGSWSSETPELLGHWSPEVMRHYEQFGTIPIGVEGLWKLQAGIREALTDTKGFSETEGPRLTPPETGYQLMRHKRSSAEFPLRFELGRAAASGVVTTTGALQMLWATVFFDTVRGIRFKVCAREDCGNIFGIEDRRKRFYCPDGGCGHVVSERKRRERESKRVKREKEAKRKAAADKILAAKVQKSKLGSAVKSRRK